VQRVLREQIVFTPSGDGYTFEAPTRFDKLFAGIAVSGQKTRPEWMPEAVHTEISADDTLDLDVDFGRLLERTTELYAKG
jgi:hypothetical protein